MQKTQPVFRDFRSPEERPLPSNAPVISTTELIRCMQGWVLDGELQGFTDRTLEERRRFIGQVTWFLQHRGYPHVGTHELRDILAHVRSGHTEPGGRWGRAGSGPVKPRTVELFYDTLKSLFRWLVEDGVLPASPLAPIKPPVSRQDDIQPFTREQVEALLAASRKTLHSRRDEALILFLWDTGVRASEVCGLRLADVDFQAFTARVHGKGEKDRPVYFGKVTKKALWRYVHEGADRPLETPLFLSDRGPATGEALTRSGLFQLVRRIGKAAGIRGARCSPHTFRHTFAVDFLIGGGDAFSLQKLLGHTSQTMTQRYVQLARAQVAQQHRKFSPADQLRKR